MISIPGSLSFAKLVMMSSAPAKSSGDARYASQDPLIHLLIVPVLQTRLQSVLGVRSYYVERNNVSIDANMFLWPFKVTLLTGDIASLRPNYRSLALL